MKTIFLTIDDGPSIYTRDKINFLLNNEIPALFFCPGKKIEEHPQLTIELIQAGFLIGNHSYSHPYFSEISEEACFEEIRTTEALIEECYVKAKRARTRKVIRLPYGDRGGANAEAIQEFLKAEGFIDIGWDFDTRDYKQKLIEHPELYLQGLEDHWQQSALEEEILLLHDFDHNHHLFLLTMAFLKNKGVKFSHVP